MTVAVEGNRQRATAVAARIEMSGLIAVEDTRLQDQSGFAGVTHGIDPRAMKSAIRNAEPLAFARRVTDRRLHGRFQPIWAVYPEIKPMGFELLVIDDDDATEQLDLFHASLFGSSTRPAIPRSHMTINPRGNWQGYGFPHITSRG